VVNEKGIVVASMVWLGVLIVLGRSTWLTKTRTFVVGVTHPGSPEAAALAAGTSHGDLQPGDWARFGLGYGGLWLAFAVMLDVPSLRPLAAALAASIAIGASGLYLEEVVKGAGLVPDTATQ
jgi:hypothetical protein